MCYVYWMVLQRALFDSATKCARELILCVSNSCTWCDATTCSRIALQFIYQNHYFCVETKKFNLVLMLSECQGSWTCGCWCSANVRDLEHVVVEALEGCWTGLYWGILLNLISRFSDNQWQNIFAKTDFDGKFQIRQCKNLLTPRIHRILPASMFPRPPQSMLCWLLVRIIQKVAHYASSAWKYEPETNCFMSGSSVLSSTLTVGGGVGDYMSLYDFSSVFGDLAKIYVTDCSLGCTGV